MQDRHRYEDQSRQGGGRFAPDRRFDRDRARESHDDRERRRFTREDDDVRFAWDRYGDDRRDSQRGYGVWEGTPSDEREYREERRRDPWGAYAADEDRARHGYEEGWPNERRHGFGGDDQRRRFERDFGGRFGGGSDFRGTQQRGPHAGKGPKNYQRSDQRILEDAHEALERDPELDASEIDATCESGEIVLRGTVESRQARRRAEECVESVAGVKDVRNELRVQGAEPSQATRSPGSGNGERPGAGSQRATGGKG